MGLALLPGACEYLLRAELALLRGAETERLEFSCADWFRQTIAESRNHCEDVAELRVGHVVDCTMWPKGSVKKNARTSTHDVTEHDPRECEWPVL